MRAEATQWLQNTSAQYNVYIKLKQWIINFFTAPGRYTFVPSVAPGCKPGVLLFYNKTL